jgi:hypothetical protein
MSCEFGDTHRGVVELSPLIRNLPLRLASLLIGWYLKGGFPDEARSMVRVVRGVLIQVGGGGRVRLALDPSGSDGIECPMQCRLGEGDRTTVVCSYAHNAQQSS